MLTNIRTQHPIGQGCFHSGKIRVNDDVVTYVYDCGSEKRSALRTAISDYADREDLESLDLLFISHLDSDHVSGIDSLLASVATQNVVLPYLSNIERLIIVAQAVADGKLNGTLLAFARDPVAWLASRGVERIIFVEGDGGDDNEPPSFPSDPIIPSDDDSDSLLQGKKEPLRRLAVDVEHLRQSASRPATGRGGRRRTDCRGSSHQTYDNYPIVVGGRYGRLGLYSFHPPRA